MGGMLDYVAGLEEYVGADEIVGLDEIIGAMKNNPAAANEMIRRLATVRQAGGVMTVPKKESFKRKLVPVQSQEIAIGGTVTFSVGVQEMFRPERLVIGVDPDDFLITSIKVGTREQLAASGQVPGGVFARDAWGTAVEFDTANLGSTITITVQNLNAAARNFYATFIGSSIG